MYDNNKEKQNIQALKTGNSYRVITSNHLLDVSKFLLANKKSLINHWKIDYKRFIAGIRWKFRHNGILLATFCGCINVWDYINNALLNQV